MSARLYLVDTNILLFYLRGGSIGKYIQANYPFDSGLFDSLVCVVSKGEILAFSKKRKWGDDKNKKLEQLLENLVTVDISSNEVLNAYAELDAYSESNGRRMGKNDLWIAATAKATGAIVLTTDKDFDYFNEQELIDVEWLDPEKFKSKK
jgi:predicted nucleic acid-binding protein